MDIKSPNISDAEKIMEINNEAWKDTYAGLIPEEIINKHISNSSNRVKLLREEIKMDNVLVAIEKNEILGFVIYGPSRDSKYSSIGEIYAIYIQSQFHGMKIGTKLLHEAFHRLKIKEFNEMIVKCLSGNPHQKFYKKNGGKLIEVVDDEAYGYPIEENVYKFDYNKIKE